MCGIVGFVSKGDKQINADALINFAYENKHRGEKDGVGIIDVENKKNFKTLLTLEEMKDLKLSDDRDKIKNKKSYEKTLESFKKYSERKSNFVILHHRKASVGNIKIRNTHPFKITESIYYIHNGTLYESEVLKKFIESNGDFKFKSCTDSEVLSWCCEKRLGDKKSIKKIYDYLSDVFYCWGVLIRVNTAKKSMLVFKDSVRDLYVCENEDGLFLISEPVEGVEKYDKISKLMYGNFSITENGILKIGKGEIKDVTDKIKKFYSHTINDIRCDCCENGKEKTIKVKYETKFKNMRCTWDYCVNCFINDLTPTSVRKEQKKQEEDITQYH